MSTHLNVATQLRPARAADADALERLAALDSSTPLTGPVLVAVVGGELQAAVGLLDDRAIADPFRHTAHLVQQLRKEARALRRRERRATLRRRARAPRPAPASA